VSGEPTHADLLRDPRVVAGAWGLCPGNCGSNRTTGPCHACLTTARKVIRAVERHIVRRTAK